MKKPLKVYIERKTNCPLERHDNGDYCFMTGRPCSYKIKTNCEDYRGYRSRVQINIEVRL